MTTILECGHPESPHSDFTRGYGTDSEGNRHCYECCAKNDREQMRRDGKTCLYLTIDDDTKRNPQCSGHGSHKLTNWPGSLEIPVHYVKTGRHNWAGNRYDFWFQFEGTSWHGVTYGDNTQIAHCKRLKAA